MMNRKITLLAVALGMTVSLSAQDLIVKTDATQVEARVLEISPEQIRYKRFSNPDGPTYVLPVSAVDYIRYANGETEAFRAAQPAQPEPASPQPAPSQPAPSQAVPAQPATPATPADRPAETAAAPTPVYSPAPATPYALQRYNIGDFYDVDGVKGVVCQLNEDRTHGLILSLDEIYLHWSEFDKTDLRTVGADDVADGRANMEKVAAYIAANNGSWDDFPAFKWCRDKGEGWYLPAINELLTIGHNYNGGSRAKYDRQARNRFNDALKEHGGDRMDRLVYYFSSTEKDEKSACTSHMDLEPPFVVEIPKYQKFLVRAVRRF